MNNQILEIIKELYQILFIGSLIFLLFNFSKFAISIYKNYKYDTNEKYVTYKYDKLLYWIAITLMLSYII